MNKPTKIGVGIFILIVIVGLFFVFSGNDVGSKVNTGSGDENVREIVIDAQRFDFSPGEIRVSEGERIRLKINNLDATHGINIPSMSVSGNDVVEFTANAKGEFDFFCNNFCGGGHSGMSGKIIVE